ncbi:MAG: hypothetical protein CVV10_04755 [Gammaproteobacteria bacterium HGW-Gammaproteobacteria-14]|nr:MAG: hypothetical protein CVV10_04755 [Gammaproteobacteria bacterium HGW-Gammaproteobacteria-14]
MKRMLAVALLVITSAVEAGVAKADLLLLEMNTWRARMGFHQLSINGNAPDDIRALEQILAAGESQVDVLKANATPAQQESVMELEALWAGLDERARDNPLATLGYADFNAFAELNRLVVQVVQLVEKLKEGAVDGPHDGLVGLGVGLQRMASEYLALTAFPSAGINTGTSESAINFSVEAMSFEQGLGEQERKYRNDEVMNRVLTQTRMRWSFIRNAVPEMDDPDSAKVPLLFYRYSSQIADDLARHTAPSP